MNTSAHEGNNSSNMLEFQGYNQEFLDYHHHRQNQFLHPSNNFNLQWPTQSTAPIFSSSLPPLPPFNALYKGWNLDHHFGLASFYNQSSQFGAFHADMSSKFMSPQEIMDAKALAASKSHSEAERRRRERINLQYAKLRSLLPSTAKTDKASLLAEVIQHVKELRRQTSEIEEESALPTESDELTIESTYEKDGEFMVKASLSCEDRPDLLPDLIKALKSLHLRALKAEITTLGGRVKNMLVITSDENYDHDQMNVTSIQDALKAVMERNSSSDSQLIDQSVKGGIKRHRTTTNLYSV